MEGAERARLGHAGLIANSQGRALAFLAAIAACSLAFWSATAFASQPPTLTTLHAVHSLSKAEARGGLPVAFEATVTYYNKSDIDLFVQEGGEAIYVETRRNEDFTAGDRVLVRGKTRDSFTPDVVSDSVTVLHHGALPAPVGADFGQLIRAERDCLRVSVKATVRSADTVNFGSLHGVYLKLLLDGGSIDAAVLGTGAANLKELLDAEVEVTGVVSGKFDSKMQLIGVLLEVPTIADVKILKPAPVSPDSLPVTPMDRVLTSSYVHDLTRRVRVQGTITYYQPGSAVVLQNGDRSLWISTRSSNPLRIGDVAMATGFPDTHDGFLALTDGEIQDTNVFEPVMPQASTWRQLATWNSGNPDGHQNDLVSFEGQVVTEVREDSQDEIVLSSNGKLFTAIYRHPPANRALPPMREILQGARIRVVGICMVVQANTVDPTEQEVPFNILLRSFDDVTIVEAASLLNVRNLALVAGLLLVLLFAAIGRGWLTERKVRRQNATAAYLESRRSRILEDINGTRPLAEVLEMITELVSIKLRGVRCWCQLSEGEQYGNCPKDLSYFRIIDQQIAARKGPPIGTIFAAFDPLIKSYANETETLTMAAALIALAVETRRLYSDLLRRSEFDLLTDIQNRFSLEKYLDQQTERARMTASAFGLIYIDLNDFKKVNDAYGHRVGDLYLRYVATRMKSQLRSDDMLARIGGDEFAVVLPSVRNRAEVEEIANRLERSLDAPFAAEGYTVQGSASVGIALYPEDGTTRDSLLSAADAAMYVNKHIRKENNSGRAGRNAGQSPEDHV
jgi:diguanylate cyclase (GGDEF)-like protein